MFKPTLKERLNQLPLWMQLILLEDITDTIGTRIAFFEKIVLKEKCGTYERKKFLEESQEALKKLGITI